MFRGFKPNERFGDFQLLRRLGHGGMGEVWLARPRFEGELPERVVLKLIFEHLADSREMLDRFLDEARLAEHLQHPNVVRVWGHGEARGTPYMAMEFIDGLNLASCLQAHGGPLLPSVAARWVADACTGLAYAHELDGRDGKPLRIVHRDISPDNLMVDVDAHVRLVDFGIARATTNDVTTQAGTRKGKLRYMAPEYFHDQVADTRTDVYSMGLTLWHLVTGTKPFGDGVPDHVVMARRFLSQGVERADVLRPSLPRSLVDVIARAVAPEASARTQSARDLRRELLDFLRDYPPPPRTELAAEVALWKQRLGEDHVRPKLRKAGSFGQLESTEVFTLDKHRPPGRRKAKGSAMGQSVAVAHPLDLTAVFVLERTPAPPPPGREREATTDRMQAYDTTPSVVLEPELERLAKRERSSGRRKARRKRS